MHLHHNMTVHLTAPRTQYAYDLQVPLRKMVECRTRDLHQSLLVKLNRALARQGKGGSMALEGVRSLRPFPHHPSLEGTGQITGVIAVYVYRPMCNACNHLQGPCFRTFSVCCCSSSSTPATICLSSAANKLTAQMSAPGRTLAQCQWLVSCAGQLCGNAFHQWQQMLV